MKRISKKIAFILFLLVFVFGMVSSTVSSAAGKKKISNKEENVTSNITIVRGLIENIPDDTIVVRFKRYTITGVPIEKTLGRPATKADLRQGKKVALFFENKKLTNVLIYEGVVAP